MAMDGLRKRKRRKKMSPLKISSMKLNFEGKLAELEKSKSLHFSHRHLKMDGASGNDTDRTTRTEPICVC
jgi:hypothetical protein